MTFGHPAALWGLLATVPVVALHILRSRRVQLVVSSVLGWDRIDRPAVATSVTNAPHSRCSNHVSVVVMVASLSTCGRNQASLGATK